MFCSLSCNGSFIFQKSLIEDVFFCSFPHHSLGAGARRPRKCGGDRAAGQTSALLNDGASNLKDARRKRVSPGIGWGRAVTANRKLI